MLLGEADAVHRDVERRRGVSATASARPPKTLTNSGSVSSRVMRELGVVIAANDEGPDPRLVQAPQLVGEKARGLHRGLLAVVEVAGDHERVDLLGKAEVDDRRRRPCASLRR